MMRGRVAATLQWCTEALRHALVAGRSHEASEAAANLLACVVEGPLPVGGFAGTAAELSAQDDPVSQSTGHASLAASALAVGDDAGFREHERAWREVIESERAERGRGDARDRARDRRAVGR